MVRRTFQVTDGILHLPIVDSDQMWYVKVQMADGSTSIGEFHIALTDKTPDFYVPLYLLAQMGKTVALSCEDENVPETLFAGVMSGGKIEERPDLYPNMYHEPERPQIHFSSRRGWINDPNGLVYADGAFRMCYQHNPFGPNHGGVNVSWGLAVSEDGVHFREYPDAIRPWDSKTHIASGSAIVDTKNVFGKGAGTILATYTALGSIMFKDRIGAGNRGQMLEYSTDGGYTFEKAENNPIIPAPAASPWRDPKILQLEDGSFCIAVYETFEGEDCVSFYASKDCKTWTFASRTMDLFECPDLFRLKVQQTGEELWVLYGAFGLYRIGTFENYQFHEIDGSYPMDYGSATYAGQTWNNHPDQEGRYHIAWVRDTDTAGFFYDKHKNRGVPFAQFMTLLCRFTLHRTEDGYRLFRNPIDAVDALRQGEGKGVSFSLRGEKNEHLALTQKGQIRVESPSDTEIRLADVAEPVTILAGREGLTFDPASCMVRFTSGKEYKLAAETLKAVRVIVDVHSAEFFVNGEVSATFVVKDEEKCISVEGGHADVTCCTWKMDSIWKDA